MGEEPARQLFDGACSFFYATLSSQDRERLVDTLKDIWASMVAGVQERTTNPLTFSFIASWCLWNYKFFIILAGDGSTAARLQAVDALYPFAWATYVGHAFGLPLITACAYVFIYPNISARVIDHYRTKQVAIANSVRTIEGERLLTVEDSTRMTREHEAARALWQETESRLQAQLRELRDALQHAEKNADGSKGSRLGTADANRRDSAGTRANETVAGLQRSLSAEPLNLDLDKVRILHHISKYSGSVSLDVVAGNLKMNPTLAKSELVELLDAGLVYRDSSEFWELSEEGAALVVKLLKSGDAPDT